jgi:hypothetical protein
MDGPVPIIALVLLLIAVGLLLSLLIVTVWTLFLGRGGISRWPYRISVTCAVIAVPMFILSASASSTGIGEIPMYLSFAFFLWAMLVALKLRRGE